VVSQWKITPRNANAEQIMWSLSARETDTAKKKGKRVTNPLAKEGGKVWSNGEQEGSMSRISWRKGKRNGRDRGPGNHAQTFDETEQRMRLMRGLNVGGGYKK